MTETPSLFSCNSVKHKHCKTTLSCVYKSFNSKASLNEIPDIVLYPIYTEQNYLNPNVPVYT